MMTRLMPFRPLTRPFHDDSRFPADVTAEQQPSAGPIRWHETLSAALHAARGSGRPVMLAFAARWCPCSQEMERRIDADERVVELARGFHCVKVDVDSTYGRMLCPEYGILSFPEILFFSPAGDVLTSREGLCSAVELAATMRAVAAGSRLVGR